MKTHFNDVSRVTSLIAGFIAAFITILVPGGYFYTSIHYIHNNMEADNELTASAITSIVAANPKTWRFEEIRVSEILHRRNQPDILEIRRVLDNKGMVVAEALEDTPWPTMSTVQYIYDAGSVVAQIEIIRSIQSTFIRTLFVTVISLALGILVFTVLRLIPMRAVHRAYGELSQNEIRYRSLYNSIREGLALFEPVYDSKHKIENFLILDVNPAFERLLRKKRTELIGAGNNSILDGALMDYRIDIETVITSNTSFRFETTDKLTQKHYDINLFSPSSSTFAVLIEDITERKHSEKQIHELAYYDHLTGLPNRFLLKERLDQQLARAQREGTGIAILFLDLDRFKHVNDTLGHALGDQLLIQVAKRISEDRRKSDTIARIGGDEFVILVNCDTEESGGITILAQKLTDKLATPFILADRQVFSGTSIGIATFPSDGMDSETLLKNADLAMYSAKEAGRNNFCFFTAEMNLKAYARMEMEAKIRHALAHNEFFLVFQPIIDISTDEVASAECLIRWRDASGTLIMPGAFIPVAEESGLILAIGDWVIEEACRKLKKWKEAGLPPIKISVNVSARQFGQSSFLDFLLSVIDLTGVDTRWLEIELTESSLMEDPQQVEKILAQFKKKGLSIAVDDFGTGYSSLGYLTRFAIDRLKIDRSFVRNITTNTNDQAIVETIFAMADKLGIQVVVEGVETEEQVSFLAPIGCQFIQGYYFYRPMEEESFLNLLTRQSGETG